MKYSKQVQRVGKDIQKTGANIEKIGGKLSLGITAPLTALGTMAISTANSFEDAMAKVSTIADTNSKSMAVLKEEILALSNNTGVAFAELAEAQYQAISAGVDTAQSVKFVETAVKAAKGGFTDTTTAIDGLTTVLNAYGMTADQVTDISNQMMLAQNFGKTSFGEMAQSLGNVIPTAAQLGVTTEELFSSIATLTKQGIGTSEAITGLKAAMSNIIKPSTEAVKLADQLGISFNSAHLESVGFAKFMDEIAQATGGSTEMMGKLFGSTEALNTMLVLTGKGASDFENVLSQMGETTGLTDSAFNAMQTSSQRFNIALNKIKNSMIQFGELLLPVFEKVTDMIGRVGDALNNLTPEQAQSILKFGLMVASIGPAIKLFGKLVSGVGKATTSIGKLGVTVKGLKSMKDVMKLVFSPANKVVLIMTAIALTAALVIRYWEPLKTFFIGCFNKIKELALSCGLDFEQLKEVFNKAKEGICLAIRGIVEFMQGFWSVIGPILSGIIEIVKISCSACIGAFGGILTGVVTVINGVAQTLGGIIDFIVGVFTLNWQTAWQGVVNIFKGVFEGITGICRSILNGIIGFINGAINGINKLGSFKMPEWLGGAQVGLSLPQIPMLYKGTDNWQGGTAMIHDRGAEIVDLPQGSRVYPHDESIKKAFNDGKSSAGASGVNISISNMTVRKQSDVDEIANALYNKLKKQAFNMA